MTVGSPQPEATGQSRKAGGLFSAEPGQEVAASWGEHGHEEGMQVTEMQTTR
jgi:hypothetical protein